MWQQKKYTTRKVPYYILVTGRTFRKQDSRNKQRRKILRLFTAFVGFFEIKYFRRLAGENTRGNGGNWIEEYFEGLKLKLKIISTSRPRTQTCAIVVWVKMESSAWIHVVVFNVFIKTTESMYFTLVFAMEGGLNAVHTFEG